MRFHVRPRLGAAGEWEAVFATADPGGSTARLGDAEIVLSDVVDGRLARLLGSGRQKPTVWLALGYADAGRRRQPGLPPSDLLSAVDVVLCADEGTRSRVEAAAPGVIGSAFVVPDPSEGHGAAAAATVARLLRRHHPRPQPPQGVSSARLGLLGYNLKFFSRILRHLDAVSWLETRVDEWPRFAVHDTDATRDVVQWANVIMCEWAGPNLVYASREKRPDQRLVTRLHRFELYTDHWREVEIDAVDAVITVSSHYRRLVLETTGWPADKVLIIPNWVDDLELHRPKLSGAPFHLGVLGAGTARKRLDRAVDVVGELRRHDPRFHLFVKTQMPWEFRWVWADDAERAHFDPLLARLEEPPLSDAVTFDPYGPDVGQWLRKIGFVLSTSDDESFHLAPAEGMASGAVPAVWSWPGAEHVYADRWLASSVDDMAAMILATATDEDRFRDAAAAARAEVLGSYRLDDVLERWVTLIGDVLGRF